MILLKATECHRISWNQQDLTQFHKIQHNFTRSNRIYWNPEISKDFMKSNMILLKATEFYRTLLISLQISLQISLWMSFMDSTADFIAVFIMDFTANFVLIPPYLIINFMKIWLHLPGFHWNQQGFMKSIAFHGILLKSTGFHYGFHCGFHSCEICNEIHNEMSTWNPQWNPW